MILLANHMPVLMFLAGCVLLTLILLRRSHRYFGRQTKRRQREPALEQLARPADRWTGMDRGTTAHIERQKVELYDMARDACGELNSKMLVLEELLSKSQQQITRMEQLLSDLETRGERLP